MNIRTRFAPSPTGIMHAGGIRTALFAWLYARQNNGQFILRIEDTDKKRETTGSIDHIMASLKWLGLDWNEGPDIQGDFGPYKQSDRLEIYKSYAKQLIEKGFAYADPYTEQEVEEFRKQAQTHKRPFLYRHHRPDNPPVWDGSKPLRFKIPNLKRYQWHDEVRGELIAGEEALDDFVIIKTDGFPTYNFAHIIDDQLMQISHVMRGEEFLASVPKFLAVYDAFNWVHPTYATLPPVLNKDGGKKLSKRDGAKDVLEYREDGFLPDAVNNFLASLGWNDGTEQEIYTLAELISKFDLNRVQKSGAKFDDERLIWISGHHIRDLELTDLYNKIDTRFWPEESIEFKDDYKIEVLKLVQERLKFFAELSDLTGFFFKDPSIKSVQNDIKEDKNTTIKYIKLALDVVQNLSKEDYLRSPCLSGINCQGSTKIILPPHKSVLEHNLREKIIEYSVDKSTTGRFLSVIRSAISGQPVTPGLFETMQVLGQDTVLRRLQTIFLELDK